MTDVDLKKIKKIHFIGIGGSGVSAIARLFVLQGKNVSGSDRTPSENTEELAKIGAEIFIGQDKKNIADDVELVIHTVAITEDNPEIVRARELGLPVMTYPQALSEISADKFTIAISGTHGKTTTTAMVGKILMDAGLDPTIIVGSFYKDLKSNLIAGNSKYLVIEADEYRRGFMNLSPKILVVTNIEIDHLDYYKDLKDIQTAFYDLSRKVPKNGFLVCDNSDTHLMCISETFKGKVLDYASADTRGLALKFPGKHNIKNAQCAIKVAEALGIKRAEAVKSLNNFAGTQRRFEYKGETATGALVYDDYAHNPQKLRAVLQGTRELYPERKIFAVFQPHLYSRTKSQLDEFADSFSDADMALLLPIYAAREKNDPDITSQMLAKKISEKGKQVVVFSNFLNIKKYLKKNSKNGDVILTIGAGDVTVLSDSLTG